MPSGVQVFDSNGKLVVDLTSKKLEFVKKVEITTTTYYDNYIDITVDGIVPTNNYVLCNVRVMGSETNALSVQYGRFATIISNNIVRLSTYRRITSGTNITLFVYRF